MTEQQYQNWCDFALRMARVVYEGHKRPDREFIVEHVKNFLLEWDLRDYENIINWDSTVTYTMGEYCPCDTYREWELECSPGFYWRILRDLELNLDPDNDVDVDDVAYKRAQRAEEQWVDQFMGPVACCIRAGLDMATEITGGVVGFTVGDLHAMFPRGLPEYVSRHYDADLHSVDATEGIWL